MNWTSLVLNQPTLKQISEARTYFTPRSEWKVWHSCESLEAENSFGKQAISWSQRNAEHSFPCPPLPLSVSFPLLWQNTRDKSTKRRKGLLWLTVSGVSVQGHLALLLLDLWRGSMSWWKHEAWESCSPHGSLEAERKEGSQTPNIPFKDMPPQWPISST
jgi:hypothetical protein